MLLNFILIFMHILGDFYFQTNTIANKKIGSHSFWPNFKWLLIHVAIYTLFFLPLILMVSSWKSVILLVIIFVSHLLIDGLSCFFKKKKCFKSVVFIIDQILHIAMLLAIGYFAPNYMTFKPWQILVTYQKQFELIVCLLLLMKPSSVLIDIIFSDIDFNVQSSKINNNQTQENLEIQKFNNKNDINSENNVKSSEKKKTLDPGLIIGMVERFIAFILTIANAYGALAIIVTVKTWARQNEIKDIKGFGNKYLIGTLLSLAIAIGVGILCANVVLKQ